MTDENLVQINFRNIFTCQVSVEELKSLLGKYSNTESLAQSGVTVAAKKYMFLSSTDRVVRARKGTSGLHCIKTVQGRPPLLFLFDNQCCGSGSGIRCFFDPWIRDPE